MNNSDPIARIENDAASQVSGPNFFKIGLALTSVYLVIVLGLAVYAQSGFLNMKPNEWGDFLAGIFGPLALLWVVLGFLQQGAELRYSRDALLLQAKELKASVDAQNNMGEAAWASVHVERDAQARAEATRIRNQQPILIVQSGGFTYQSTGVLETRLSITNSGRDCFRVSFALGDETLNFHPRSVSQISEGTTLVLAAQTNPGANIRDCSFLIDFMDVEGKLQKRVYHLVANDRTFLVTNELGVEVPLDLEAESA